MEYLIIYLAVVAYLFAHMTVLRFFTNWSLSNRYTFKHMILFVFVVPVFPYVLLRDYVYWHDRQRMLDGFTLGVLLTALACWGVCHG